MIRGAALAVAHLALVASVASCGRSSFDGDGDGNADAAVGDAARSPYNIAFVTSTTHAPTSYGADLAGADAICNVRAGIAGLAGTYVAYLSNPGVAARARLGTARGWLRTDGRPVLDRPSDITTGAILHPLVIDENGEHVGNADLVHTASFTDGSAHPANCAGYSDSTMTIAAGSTTGTTFEWSFERTIACTTPGRLYCFGISKSAPLVIAPVTGRRGFVTVQAFAMDGTGIAKADALCTSEATLANLPGSYRALLATETASAISRFDLGGPTWVRLDGIAVADSALAFAAGTFATTLNVTSTGSFATNYVLTGVPNRNLNATSDAAGSCASWTLPTGTTHVGWARNAAAMITVSSGGDCADTPIYCLEE